MILKEREIKSVFNDQNTNMIFLVYGPNEGLIRDIVQKLSVFFRGNETAEEIILSATSIDEEPSKLMDEIQKCLKFYFQIKITARPGLHNGRERFLQYHRGREKLRE